MKATIRVPRSFSFWRTVYSHGWCALPPFSIDKGRRLLMRPFTISDGRVILVSINDRPRGFITMKTESAGSVKSSDWKSIQRSVRTCLRMDEDMSLFFAEARKHKAFEWVSRLTAGRLMRSPTVFEDVVKMICTTNCSWALTTVIVERLCDRLGARTDDGLSTFPSPEAIADCSEKFLRKEIRAGYRAPYIRELARRVVTGDLDIESWRTAEVTTEELFDAVLSVRGVGPYAAGNILKLLGKYNFLGIDSWCRTKFFERHRNGKAVSDRTIERFYEPFGKWKGLFFWLDVTRDWYYRKFPL